ncbi:hypothetical protein PRUPE_2G050200 [Prunus persica]|uniref:Uncharacterized protein n=1 Tax=Prunus persica TaxID=3760 RepID=A0A251QBH9_PRUPE|nr:hypothetical protein PRUPE_2G050200 [Prunus persica]
MSVCCSTGSIISLRSDDEGCIKCLQYDRNLKIAALLLRSFTDLFYRYDIIVQVYTSGNFLVFIGEYHRRQHSLASEYARDYPGHEDVWIKTKTTFWSKSLVEIAKTMGGSYVILIDILAILPLPQVAILIFFSKMRDLRFLNTISMVIMNLFVLLQYVPRLLSSHLSLM